MIYTLCVMKIKNLYIYYVNVNNQKYNFQVADFGLAKIFSATTADITHISTRVVGTFG